MSYWAAWPMLRAGQPAAALAARGSRAAAPARRARSRSRSARGRTRWTPSAISAPIARAQDAREPEPLRDPEARARRGRVLAADPGRPASRARPPTSAPGSAPGPGATCSGSSPSAAWARATPGARSGWRRWPGPSAPSSCGSGWPTPASIELAPEHAEAAACCGTARRGGAGNLAGVAGVRDGILGLSQRGRRRGVSTRSDQPPAPSRPI